MEKTWKPTTAGIISIVAGAFSMITGITVVAVGSMWMMVEVDPTMMGVLSAIGIPIIVLGVVSIVGGAFAIRRRIWGLALAGGVCALLSPTTFPLGIAAIVFVAMGKGEFE